VTALPSSEPKIVLEQSTKLEALRKGPVLRQKTLNRGTFRSRLIRDWELGEEPRRSFDYLSRRQELDVVLHLEHLRSRGVMEFVQGVELVADLLDGGIFNPTARREPGLLTRDFPLNDADPDVDIHPVVDHPEIPHVESTSLLRPPVSVLPLTSPLLQVRRREIGHPAPHPSACKRSDDRDPIRCHEQSIAA
jgi:hypothetical protein